MISNVKEQRAELRKFGLTMAAAFPVFFVVIIPLLRGRPSPRWPWVLTLTLGALAVLCPRALSGVQTVWLKLGHVLGFINTRVILSLVYFLVIFPFGLIMRLRGRDPMARAIDRGARSYRVERKAESPHIHMERPY